MRFTQRTSRKTGTLSINDDMAVINAAVSFPVVSSLVKSPQRQPHVQLPSTHTQSSSESDPVSHLHQCCVCVVPGQVSVAADDVSVQTLGQMQRLLTARTDVIQALRQEHHTGSALFGLLHQSRACAEVGLFVRGGGHLTNGRHRK